MSDIILATEGLFFSYPTRQEYALRNINLGIQWGEFVAIIGQNGSGKTTLIKHFNGLLKPTAGRVLVEGRETTKIPASELARSIGYVFQNPDHQIFAEKVRDEVAFGPRNLGFDEDYISRVTEEVLSAMGLAETIDEMPFMLSRGQRQRLAVAAVLAMEPSVLIIDEPTTGQDWKESIALMELVKKLNDRGHTVVITTHNMNLVSLYARRVVVMRLGEVWLDGTTQEVFRKEERLCHAAIKPPEIYRLVTALLPDTEINSLVTPDSLAAMLAERMCAG